MYATENFKTKSALKKAVAEGGPVTIYQMGGLFAPAEGDPGFTGKAFVEGPHFPEPHRWYAQVDVVNGIVVKVK